MMKHIKSNNTRTTLSRVRDEDIQPNAVDVRVHKIFRVSSNVFILGEDHKTHRGHAEELKPNEDGFFYLTPGVYEVVMDNIINVGQDEAGWVITRSTLIRNGLFITSGLYDSGYHGAMAAVLHVTCGPAYIKEDARIGQYICVDADMISEYNGSYGFDASGAPKQDEAKYHS